MFKKIALKLMIIIIFLFGIINTYPLRFNNLDINVADVVETKNISVVETRNIKLLPYIKDAETTGVMYPIFRIDLDIEG